MINPVESSNNGQIHTQKASKPVDVYSETPIRLLGFTNELGAAISPIIGPVGELISYAPALSYIAMDTSDKYQRGYNNDEKSKKPCHKRATTQLIFQMMASVIFPTAAVKGAQILGNKVIDSHPLNPTKNSVKNFITKNKTLNNIISKFSDKPHAEPKGRYSKQIKALRNFAEKFGTVLDYITVIPAVVKKQAQKSGKPIPPKSGLRNMGSAAIGLAALSLAIKPIDHFSEHIISKFVKPTIETHL